MKNKPINVFLLDDEFPIDDEFRRKGIYNTAISTDDLYHLAVNREWNHLIDLQQLIKDLVSSQPCKEGLINLVGFNTPTLALHEIQKGELIPDIVIYDWEYPNAPIYNNNSTIWLLEILNRTKAFIFVYSKRRNELPKFLNQSDFTPHSNRFQLLLKGGGINASFTAEELILQYIIGTATNSGKIKIDGIEVEFTSNDYLEKASDILYLQRILGNQYVLDELKNIDFSINTAGVEKILNDSQGYLYFLSEKNLLISPEELSLIQKYGEDNLQKITYLDVVKKYSLYTLEDVLEKGIAPIIS
ncbi:hypothetical protein [Elizabethkingia anophelis]|uniref:hypothetical protein n=1 Tax=Elizabethkingia anophelis TaxID=1117645 RepID=UPI0038917C58